MYLDKWRVAIRNLKNTLFSYPCDAPSCFPDPITDESVIYCIQGFVYESGKFSDGKFIHTSAVKEIYKEDGRLFARTRNNCYELKNASPYFDFDIAANAAAKLESHDLAQFAEENRAAFRSQFERFREIAHGISEGSSDAAELPESTLIICYNGTDPNGNKVFFKNDVGIVPVFHDVHSGVKVDSVGLAESEEKLEMWETLGRYYVDSEVMEFYDCDTENLLFYNMTDKPIYIIIYGSSAAMLCPPETAKLASRKSKKA